MYERYNKEIVYFLCTHFALNELFLGYLAGIDDTDRHGNTDIFAYNKRMNGRDTDILVKKSGNKRSACYYEAYGALHRERAAVM